MGTGHYAKKKAEGPPGGDVSGEKDRAAPPSAIKEK